MVPFTSGLSEEPDLTGIAPIQCRYFVRAARPQDVGRLADVLTDSFHPSASAWYWMAPIFRMGIREELRTRLRTQPAHYACLVGVQRPEQRGGVEPQFSLDPELQAQDRPLSASGDRPVGTVEIDLRPQAINPWLKFWGARYPYISNLAVDAHHRRQGIAEQLLSCCERVALTWGYRDLYLHVLENNSAAISLYTKLGYQTQRIEPDLAASLLGNPRQILLHKRLPSNASL